MCMKRALGTLVCILLVMTVSSCAVAPSAVPLTQELSSSLPVIKKDGVVLIYNGKVAAEGCPEALAVVAKSIGMNVEYFNSAKQLPDLLLDAAMCMIGGTEDDLGPLVKEFTPEIRQKLEDWISAGGGFLGICGGGYIGSKGWEEDGGFVEMLGLVPVLAEEYLEDPDPRIITVNWDGAERNIYYAYGPAFVVENAPDIEVIARYSDGRVAVLEMKLGKGRVILSGPHPEADETWLEDDPVPLNAGQWEPTDDLITDLFQRLRRFLAENKN